MRIVITVVCVIAMTGVALAEGVLLSWGGGDLQGMTEARWERARKRTPAEILALNKSASSWPEVYEVLLGANARSDEREFLGDLAAQVVESPPRRLTQTSRLIIWERIISGDILFEGKGYQADDDLFRLAGRANWILRRITNRDFGHVTSSSTAEEISVIRAAWVASLAGDEPTQCQAHYASDVEGSGELRSLEALEALVISLRPSKPKDRLTSDCLRNLYGLDSLPSDPTSPASMCNPDAYANIWLSSLTGIPGARPYEWWTEWWGANKDHLQWNQASGHFEVDSTNGITTP